jgi:Na+/serine symporter
MVAVLNTFVVSVSAATTALGVGTTTALAALAPTLALDLTTTAAICREKQETRMKMKKISAKIFT